MPLSTGIKTQRSAVVLLSGVTFEHNPDNTNGQQVKEGGIAIEATDSSIIYIKEEIVFNLNADKWFRAANNSNITWLADFDIIVSNQASDSSVIPFDLYRNSTIDLKAGEDSGTFSNNSIFTLAQLLSGTKIDTSSSLYINNDLETEVKKDPTNIKGSLNNIFYSAGQPYIEINSLEALPLVKGTNTITIGPNVEARTGTNGVLIGNAAYILDNADNGIAIGTQANITVGAKRCIAIGNTAIANGTETIAIGNNAVTSGGGGFKMALGPRTLASGTQAIAIGLDADSTNLNSMAFGRNTLSSGEAAICIGNESTSTAKHGIALGHQAESTSQDCIAIGRQAKVSSGFSSIALGAAASCTGTNSIQLNAGSNTADNSLQFLSKTIATADGLFIAETSGTPASVLQSGTPRWDPTTATLYISDGTTWKSIVLG